jgi:hypothetical protein
MTLQPEDFWSFQQWLMRPGAFLESALLQGVAIVVFVVLLGLMIGYIVSAVRYGPGEAFYTVAASIRDLVARDLPGTSLRRVGALARLAFKEAIRRKVLFVVGLFLVGLLLAGWFLEPSSDDPARLYISFVLTATNYLMLMMALFISCFSLPTDIKNRTIYTIVTKPVRATEIILGRIVGFAAVGTVMLVPMGFASYLFVVRGIQHSHQVANIQQTDDGGFTGETTYDNRHQHTLRLNSEGVGLTDFSRGHQHAVYREGDEFVVGPAENALRARVPKYGDIAFLDRQGVETQAGIDVGYEHRDGGFGSRGLSRFLGRTIGFNRIEHGYLEGGTLCAAILTFDGVSAAEYPDGLPLDLKLRVFRTFKGDIVTPVRATISIRNPESPQIESDPIVFETKEYQVDEKVIQVEIPGTDGDQSRKLNLFEDLVSSDGRVEVIIRCLDPSQYLGVTKGDVYLRPQESTFGWNMTKAYISIWCQMLMVIAFGVMFSTILSGPVAMIATFAVVLLGFQAEAVYETRYYMDRGETMGGGPLESLIRTARQDSLTVEMDIQSVPLKIIKGIDNVAVYTQDAIVTSLPNLPKMAGTAEYVASGFDIFGGLLLRHIVATFGFVLLAFFVGYFLLKSREIAA